MRRCHRSTVHTLAASVANSRGDLFAGREDVRFAPTVARGSASGKVAHAVEVGIAAVRRADGYHVVGVSRVGDADRAIASSKALLFGTCTPFKAGIAGGRNDNSTGADQMVACLADRC